MTETILLLIQKSLSDNFAMVMPDTYFMGENPRLFFRENPGKVCIASWKIRDSQRGKLGQIEIAQNQLIRVVDKDPGCELEDAWGALAFNREFVQCLDAQMPHVGYGLPNLIKKEMPHLVKEIAGEYFDCGTPSEYFSLVSSLYLN